MPRAHALQGCSECLADALLAHLQLHPDLDAVPLLGQRLRRAGVVELLPGLLLDGVETTCCSTHDCWEWQSDALAWRLGLLLRLLLDFVVGRCHVETTCCSRDSSWE